MFVAPEVTVNDRLEEGCFNIYLRLHQNMDHLELTSRISMVHESLREFLGFSLV